MGDSIYSKKGDDGRDIEIVESTDFFGGTQYAVIDGGHDTGSYGSLDAAREDYRSRH